MELKSKETGSQEKKKNTEDTEKNPENGPERTSKLGRN